MQNDIQSRLQSYGKIISSILATVIVTSFYAELKHRTQRQLEDRDLQLRLGGILCGFRSYVMGSNGQQAAAAAALPSRLSLFLDNFL